MKTPKFDLGLIGVSLILFIMLVAGYLTGSLSPIDTRVYDLISPFICSELTQVALAFSFMGSAWALTVLTILSYLLLRKRMTYYANLIIANVILSTLLNEALKVVFHRPRPGILVLADVVGYSFPSGHSMVSMSFYGLLLYMTLKEYKNKRGKVAAGILLTLLILGIGLSRIYLGVHYVTDVLAGFSVGLSFMMSFVLFTQRFKRKEATA